MSDTPQTDELLTAFSEWTQREEELWLSVFQDTSQLLMGAMLDPEAPDTVSKLPYQERCEILQMDVTMAAELADRAVKEMQVRWGIQKEQKRKARTQAKSAYETRANQRAKTRSRK